MSGRQLAWSAAHDRRRVPSPRQSMGDGWQERDPLTGSGRRDGWSAVITGRRWRRDHWRGTRWHSMGERQRTYGYGKHRPGGKSRGRTACPSRQRETRGAARGGIPRTSGNEGGNAGTFYAPACPWHRGHFGGGKHPIPMVNPMWHSGTLAYTEWKAHHHRTVRHWIGAEEAAVSEGVIKGEHGEGLWGLWLSFGKCDGV